MNIGANTERIRLTEISISESNKVETYKPFIYTIYIWKDVGTSAHFFRSTPARLFVCLFVLRFVFSCCSFLFTVLFIVCVRVFIALIEHIYFFVFVASHSLCVCVCHKHGSFELFVHKPTFVVSLGFIAM